MTPTCPASPRELQHGGITESVLTQLQRLKSQTLALAASISARQFFQDLSLAGWLVSAAQPRRCQHQALTHEAAHHTKLYLQVFLCASFTMGAVLTALLACACAVVVLSATVAGFLLSGVGKLIHHLSVHPASAMPPSSYLFQLATDMPVGWSCSGAVHPALTLFLDHLQAWQQERWRSHLLALLWLLQQVRFWVCSIHTLGHAHIASP
jgi:hypothetical protein